MRGKTKELEEEEENDGGFRGITVISNLSSSFFSRRFLAERLGLRSKKALEITKESRNRI